VDMEHPKPLEASYHQTARPPVGWRLILRLLTDTGLITV
jgi:hypothetical protein